MTQIGAFDAKNQFSKLLDRARRGEEFVITHRGKPVAKLVPAEPVRDAEAIGAAFDRLRENVRHVIGPPVTAAEIKEWIEEGRR